MTQPKFRVFHAVSFASFSGVKSVDKREGGGSHNWGTFEDEMKAEEDKNNVSTDAEKSEKAEGEKEKEVAPEEPREEEPKTFTLDEWKKQQAKKDDKPKFNTRKAGEGSDMDPKWKKTYAYKKERENVHDDEDDEVSDHDNLAGVLRPLKFEL